MVTVYYIYVCPVVTVYYMYVCHVVTLFHLICVECCKVLEIAVVLLNSLATYGYVTYSRKKNAHRKKLYHA